MLDRLSKAVAKERTVQTELERVQQRLEARDVSAAISDERSRQLLRSSPFGIMIGSDDGRVGYVNPPLVKLLGYTAEGLAIRGITWKDITPPEFHAADLAAISEVKAKGFCPAYYKEFLASDGRHVPVMVGVALIPNLDGTHDMAGFITDLTELKRAERELAQSRDLLAQQYAEMEALYQTAPMGLAFFDAKDFRYLRLNDQQAEIVGKPKNEILGRTLTEIAPIEGLQEMLEQVASGTPVVNKILEGELPSRPGEKRAWTVNCFPANAPDGSLQGIAVASVEITQLKWMEEALIQNEKLAAVGRLASSISHEINNPLEAVTNLLYLARIEKDSDRRNNFLETAEHEVARVSQIATQTLRFHRQPGNPTLLAASDLVEPVLALYAGRLNGPGIKIERSYRSKTPACCMEGDFRQVLNNLIGNAIDAMRSSGSSSSVLKIRSADIVDPRTGLAAVRLTLSDTGVGMSEETLSRIFEAFYSTKGNAGTGLGMWISKGIVDKHGGRLTMRSRQRGLRRGTIFQLYLPRDEQGMNSPCQASLELQSPLEPTTLSGRSA